MLGRKFQLLFFIGQEGPNLGPTLHVGIWKCKNLVEGRKVKVMIFRTHSNASRTETAI